MAKAMNYRYISIGQRSAIVILSTAPTPEQKVQYHGQNGLFELELEILSVDQYVLAMPNAIVARITSNNCDLHQDGKILYSNPAPTPQPVQRRPYYDLRYRVFDRDESTTTIETIDAPPNKGDRVMVSSPGFTDFVNWTHLGGNRYRLDRALVGQFDLKVYYAQELAKC